MKGIKGIFQLGMIALALSFMVLVGCQTTTVTAPDTIPGTVLVSYTEPAHLNLSGVKRVAIDSDNPLLVTPVSQSLTATGKYTVASAEELSAWKQWKGTVISATDLVEAYAGNAARADSYYLKKTLKITDVAEEIGKNFRGNYFVRFGTDSDKVVAYFAPSEINRVATVDKGQTITIIGECLGLTPPNTEVAAEILQIMGGGRAINITNATFLKDYTGAVDAVISLNTTSSVEEGSHSEKVAALDSNGKPIRDANGYRVYRDAKFYDRSITVNIAYQIVRAQDSSSIGEGTKSATLVKSSEDPSELPAPADLVAQAIDKPVGEFTSEIVPTQRSISIALAKVSNNTAAYTAMREAANLVGANKYAEAVAAYGEIYAKYKIFAAGYNQALLTEAIAGTEVAIELMEALSKKTYNLKAQTALEDMRSRNDMNKESAAQISE